jgi:hypothetical protein
VFMTNDAEIKAAAMDVIENRCGWVIGAPAVPQVANIMARLSRGELLRSAVVHKALPPVALSFKRMTTNQFAAFIVWPSQNILTTPSGAPCFCHQCSIVCQS